MSSWSCPPAWVVGLLPHIHRRVLIRYILRMTSAPLWPTKFRRIPGLPTGLPYRRRQRSQAADIACDSAHWVPPTNILIKPQLVNSDLR